MEPRITKINTKLLIGKRLRMSVANDRTVELWQLFMPQRSEIHQVANNFLYSVQVFDSENYFSQFLPEAEFDKWAAVKVSDFTDISADMKTLEIPEGN